jgi:basic membrane protein A
MPRVRVGAALLARVSLFSFTALGLLVASCDRSKRPEGPEGSSAPEAASGFRVGLVLDKGGRDDKSFNASAHAGATLAVEKLGVQYKYVEATDDGAFEALLRAFVKKDFDLVVGVGFGQREAVKKVAEAFQSKNFVLIDAELDLPNVRSLVFEEHEGAFLMGAAAALASSSGKVGMVGGMDVPLIRRFELGYRAGAKQARPSVEVQVNFVGSTGDAWNNPPRAKELALAQYASGVDVIFQVAGASGAGIFDAAEEKGKLAIGVDSNQNWVKPGRVLTSMLKRVDLALFAAIEESVREPKKVRGGVRRFGLASQGVDYSVDEHNAKVLTPAIRAQLEELKARIIAASVESGTSGTAKPKRADAIEVPDFYKTR